MFNALYNYFYYDGSTYDYFYICGLTQNDDDHAYFIRFKATSASSITSISPLSHTSNGNGMYVYGCYVSSTSVDYLYTYLSYTLSNTFYFAKIDFS